MGRRQPSSYCYGPIVQGWTTHTSIQRRSWRWRVLREMIPLSGRDKTEAGSPIVHRLVSFFLVSLCRDNTRCGPLLVLDCWFSTLTYTIPKYSLNNTLAWTILQIVYLLKNIPLTRSFRYQRPNFLYVAFYPKLATVPHSGARVLCP
jgi:hypothetical protein